MHKAELVAAYLLSDGYEWYAEGCTWGELVTLCEALRAHPTQLAPVRAELAKRLPQ